MPHLLLGYYYFYCPADASRAQRILIMHAHTSDHFYANRISVTKDMHQKSRDHVATSDAHCDELFCPLSSAHPAPGRGPTADTGRTGQTGNIFEFLALSLCHRQRYTPRMFDAEPKG